MRSDVEVVGAWPEEAIHSEILQAGCGEEELGQVISDSKLPSTIKCPHQRVTN